MSTRKFRFWHAASAALLPIVFVASAASAQGHITTPKEFFGHNIGDDYFLPNYDDVVVCTYDLNKFSASVVMDVMRTHPMVIIGGILQENPFYVPPDEFLRELKGRAA